MTKGDYIIAGIGIFTAFIIGLEFTALAYFLGS